jgi:Tfp pilus assembly protein PilN
MALSLKKITPTKGKDVAADAPTTRSKKAQAEYDAAFVPRIPIVNLLSPELQEMIERTRLKRLFALLTVGLVVAMAVLWGAQTALINAAQSRLEDEQAISNQLAAEQNALAPVRSFYGQIDANRATIQTTMQNEVLTSQVLTALEEATPPGVSVDSFGLTLGGSTAAAGAADPSMTSGACPSANPYEAAAPSAGCITVSGSASNRSVVGQWLDNLEAQPMFTVAFIPSTTADPEGGRITFTASVGLDAATAYQNRYADDEFLKAGGN